MTKLSLVFSNIILWETRRSIVDKLGYKELKNGSLYQDNFFLLGRSKVMEFNTLKERVQARLNGWQSQLLSRASNMTRIRSVIHAMLVYSTSTFRVPKGIYNYLDVMSIRF